MSEELMPCPIPNCGKPVELTSAEYANTYDDFVLCTEDHCPYSATAEQHRILARRARIGELCERLMHDEATVAVRMSRVHLLTEDSEVIDIIHWFRAKEPSSGQRFGQGGTLLAALENLAQAIGGDDE